MLIGGESRIIVNGIDLTEKFGVLYTDESALNPPEKIPNYKSIPAMDGVLDLSEALTGDMVYGQRKETVVLDVPQDKNFEQVKTDISNFLDGRRFDYTYSFDQAYTRTGRFRVVDYPGWRVHRIEIEIDADPWKRGAHQYYTFSAKGGKEIVVFNSRRHVTPVITTKKRTIIEYQGRAWDIPEAGSWTLDLRLQEGVSTIYANTAPSEGDRTWADLAATYSRWRDIPKSMRWCDIYFKRKPVGDTSDYVTIEYDLYDL